MWGWIGGTGVNRSIQSPALRNCRPKIRAPLQLLKSGAATPWSFLTIEAARQALPHRTSQTSSLSALTPPSFPL